MGIDSNWSEPPSAAGAVVPMLRWFGVFQSGGNEKLPVVKFPLL